MPREYESIRDGLIVAGYSRKEAQAKAAAIYNSQHPDQAVGRHEQKTKPAAHQPRRKQR